MSEQLPDQFLRGFRAGARREAQLRDEQMTTLQLDVRIVWENMCKLRNDRGWEQPVAETISDLASIYWAGLPLMHRIRLAWRAAFK